MKPVGFKKSKGLIKVDGVYFRYDNLNDNKWVLKDINLQAWEGEFIAIVGANGSGKSTLLKILNGLLLPDRGSVLVDGLATSDPDKLIRIRQWVQMVFQVPEAQIVGTTVEEDLAFGPENLGLPYDEIEKRIEEASKKVGIWDLKERDSHTLSGGQKQMLAIGSAVTMKPRWLLLDEPTSMLDPESKKMVFELVLELWHAGMGIILATHSMEEALIADRIVLLKDGVILVNDVPQIVFSGNEIYLSNLELPEVLVLARELKKYWKGLKDFYRSKTELIEDVLKQIHGNSS